METRISDEGRQPFMSELTGDVDDLIRASQRVRSHMSPNTTVKGAVNAILDSGIEDALGVMRAKLRILQSRPAIEMDASAGSLLALFSNKKVVIDRDALLAAVRGDSEDNG